MRTRVPAGIMVVLILAALACTGHAQTTDPKKFHDGSLLTPDDVEYTFERAMLSDPAGGPAWMFLEPLLRVQTLKQLACKLGGLDSIDDMKAMDPALARKVFEAVDRSVEVEGDNVVFRLAAPYPPFLQILCKGGGWSAITSKKWLTSHGGRDGKPDTWLRWYDQPKEEMALYEVAMGTGPFKLAKWDPSGGQVVFKRFDGYWQGPARLETVVLKFIDEYNTRRLMLQTGEADAIRVNIAYLDQVRQIPGVTVIDRLPYIGNTALLFNLNIPVEGNVVLMYLLPLRSARLVTPGKALGLGGRHRHVAIVRALHGAQHRRRHPER